MLQQTQVARVADRIVSFLQEFPDPSSMARASRQDVLAAWAGLGYNRRAVRLHDASIIIDRSGWPKTSRELRSLPGVGRYTAAAVACFAFGEQVAAVDINVRRVLSRWAGRVLSPTEAAAVAERLLPPDEAHRWIQAIMDLGSSTCTARQPSCERCPCQPWCTGADIEVSSRPQAPFKGSLREARGLIVRALSESGAVTLDDLSVSVEASRLARAAEALALEGLVRFENGVVTLHEPLDSHQRGR